MPQPQERIAIDGDEASVIAWQYGCERVIVTRGEKNGRRHPIEMRRHRGEFVPPTSMGLPFDDGARGEIEQPDIRASAADERSDSITMSSREALVRRR